MSTWHYAGWSPRSVLSSCSLPGRGSASSRDAGNTRCRVSPSEFVAALSWSDGLDFGLLCAITYGALTLLRGTRIVPVLLSVAFFVGMSFVARSLDLVAVATLLEYFLEYVIIILIVVFHQELRRLLLRIGQRLLPHSRRRMEEDAVENLVVGVQRLRRARIGALFILEGELDVLGACSDAGIEVDAALRPETLVALAVPHPANTAHDGGILIRDFRIARCGVICPLSSRDAIDPRFGTRHRGAIGLSEETDALALVLSEERGEVRVVIGARVSEALSGADLKLQIQRWMERPAVSVLPPVAARGAADESVVTDPPDVREAVE